MKNIISVAVCFALLLFVFLFTSCGKSDESSFSKMIDELPSEITEKFADMQNIDEIYKDIKFVDLYHTPDLDGLTLKTEVDDETSTSKNFYYSGDTLVYIVYNGYGEECFDFFTKSESGKDITVKYVDMNSKRYSVDIDGENYFVCVENLNKASRFGADTIYFYLTKETENTLPKKVCYDYSNDRLSMNGNYYAEDGYHGCGAYQTEDGFDSYDDVIYECDQNIEASDSIISAAVNDERVDCLQTIFGMQTLKYSTENGEERWYLVSDVMAVFENKDDANDFAAEYGFEAEKLSEIYVVKMKNTIVEFSDEFEDIEELALLEVNDYYYCKLVLDEENKLVGFSRDGVTVSFY